MFKNYFTTAFRSLRRNKVFSVINVLGLSIGISAALVIFLIAYYEFSYDKFEPDRDRIYRVVLDAGPNLEGHGTGLPAPLGAAVENEVTGVEHAVPVFSFQGDANAKVVIDADKANPVVYKKQTDIIFTNQHYFYLLPYKWITGSPKAALKDPFSVVLTESRARQYFPSVPAADVIGKKIVYNDDLTVTVSGIVKDLNETTDFTSAEFISLPTIAKTNLQKNFMMDVWDDWMAYSHLYVKLSKGSKADQTEKQLAQLLKKYNKNTSFPMVFHLQPLSDMHFNANYPSVGQRLGNKTTLYGLLAIAAFLLLLGCINFINLTTAQASQRAKEIGIRKTMGSSKKQLIFQFLSETFFLTSIATVLSVALMPFLLKIFVNYIPPGLHFDIIYQPQIIFFLILLTIVLSFLSGLYPALILSGFNPVLVLKGQSVPVSGQTRNAWVRKTLTVSQFVIAQFFIIATAMVSKQINFSIHSDMGFRKDAILTFNVPHNDTVAAHPRQLLNEIKSMPEVELAATGFFSPADEGLAIVNVSYAEKPDVHAQVQIRWGDTNYMKVYQIPLLAGRNVMASDHMQEFIINETYSKILGFKKPEDALNKYLGFNGKNLPIVGVMKDFHEMSTRAPIMPVVFAGNNGSTFHIRLRPNDANGNTWKNAIAKMQKAYQQIYPAEEFSYRFFDETIEKLYQNEQHTASLLTWATGLTVFISCLGLLGLVIYTTNTRTKEVGIRKILGASVANIVSILSKDFVQLVLIAFVIAAPLAWWAVYKWLESFTYKTTMSWWIFAGCGLAMLFIALVTLSIQTVKTAMENPAKSLRSE